RGARDGGRRPRDVPVPVVASWLRPSARQHRDADRAREDPGLPGALLPRQALAASRRNADFAGAAAARGAAPQFLPPLEPVRPVSPGTRLALMKARRSAM